MNEHREFGQLLTAGEWVNSTYLVEGRIGSGSFAEVYLVSHRFLGRQAMKVLFPESSDNLQEARYLVDLNHPRIIRVYDANVVERNSQELKFVTMEYSSRGTLNSLLAAGLQSDLKLALRMGTEVAEAMAYAHSLVPPLVHRDIKPSNILIVGDESPHIKVTDFGLAEILDSESRLCNSAGTLAYAPPEIAFGIADERTDVYSIGVTLYRLLTGIHPFPIFTPEAVAVSQEYEQMLTVGRRSIKPPSQMLLRDLSDLDAIVMKALEFDMFSRYRNAGELFEDLRKVYLGDPD